MLRQQWHCQHVLRSGRSADPGGRLRMRLRACPHPPLWPELGAAVHRTRTKSPTSSFSLQLSLGPGASCLGRPLRPAKCPRGHCACALGIWAARPYTATPGLSCCRHHSRGCPKCGWRSCREAGRVTELRPGCGRGTWGRQQRPPAPGTKRLARQGGGQGVSRRGWPPACPAGPRRAPHRAQGLDRRRRQAPPR